MKKTVLLILLTGIFLCSCESKQQEPESVVSEKETKIVQTDAAVTEPAATEETTVTSENTTTEVTYDGEISYDLYVDAVSADELYNYEIIELPSTINGMAYFLCDYINGKIMVCLNKEESADHYVCDYGLYDYKTGDYTTIVPDVKNYSFLGSYENKYFFNKSESADSESLVMFNADNNEYTTIFNSVNGCSLKAYDLALYEGKVYFDAFTSSEKNNSRIYVYDIAADELDIFSENTMLPKASKSDLFYLSYEPGAQYCDKMINMSSNKVIDILNKRIEVYACFRNRVFAVIDGDVSDPYAGFDVVKELSPSADDRRIIATRSGEGELLSNIKSNDFCISWFDITGCDSTPCVYDIENDKIAVFSDMPMCYYRTYLDENSGILFDEMNFTSNHQVCVFEPKE